MNSELDLSVVIPVYLNAPTLLELSERLIATLDPLNIGYEIIFVNDASPDDSASVIASLATRFPVISTLQLQANGGQQQAIRQGLRIATGQAALVMDADLQDSPEGGAKLYTALAAGEYDAIFAERQEHYQKRSRMITSRFFKWIIRKLVGLPRGTGCFLIMSRKAISQVFAFETKAFYLPGLIAKTNLPISVIPLTRVARPSGESAYNSAMRLDVAISNIRCLLERTD